MHSKDIVKEELERCSGNIYVPKGIRQYVDTIKTPHGTRLATKYNIRQFPDCEIVKATKTKHDQ